MSNVIAVVQPCALMSVAEQKYVLGEYARDIGANIDQFLGEDGILDPESHYFDVMMQSISAGTTGHVLMLDAVAGVLPQSLLDQCKTSGARIHFVDSHKGLKLAG